MNLASYNTWEEWMDGCLTHVSMLVQQTLNITDVSTFCGTRVQILQAKFSRLDHLLYLCNDQEDL